MTHLTSSSEGTYISRKLCPESANLLLNYCKNWGVQDILDPSEFHVTIAYSRKQINPEIQLSPITVESSGVFETLGDAFVLKILSDDLTERFEELKGLGATWDWDSYIPHVSVSSNPNQEVITNINSKLFLVLCAEIMEASNLNYTYQYN